jgi:hypothetical protein
MTQFQTPLSALAALILGLFGLALVFSDLAPNETWSIRVGIAVAYFFLCGLGIGFLSRDFWLIAGLSAWGAILMGGLLVMVALGRHGSAAFNAQEPPYISSGLLLLFVPIVLSLAGGYLGRKLHARMLPGENKI